MTVEVDKPPLCIIIATVGILKASAMEKASCIRMLPGPEVAVKAGIPARQAPMVAKPAVISSSV